MLNPEQIKQLEAKLDPKHIKSRTKGGAELSYVEGWLVIEEANNIFGFDGWDAETTHMEATCVAERNGKPHVGYMAKVRVTVYAQDRKIIRDGYGHGSQTSNDIADAHEGALKEAETDAFKRAMKSFGNRFGLCLYDKQKSGVDKVISLSLDETKFIASKISLDVDASWTWEALDRVRGLYHEQIEQMPQKWAFAQIKKFDDKGAELKAKGITKTLNGHTTGATA